MAGGANLYGYAEGDPVNNGDPFGLYSERQSGRPSIHERLAAGVRGDDAQAEDDPCKQNASNSACNSQRPAAASIFACAARGREQFQDGLEQMGLNFAKPVMAIGAAWATGKVAGIIPLPASMQIGSVPVTWGGGEGARLIGGAVPRTASTVARFMNPSYLARYAVSGTLRASGALGAGLTFGQYAGTALVCVAGSNSYR